MWSLLIIAAALLAIGVYGAPAIVSPFRITRIESVAISPDGRSLAASRVTFCDYGFIARHSGVRTVAVFPLGGGRDAGRVLEQTWTSNVFPFQLALSGETFSPDGTRTVVRTQVENPSVLTFSADGARLAVVPDIAATGRISLWDLKAWRRKVVEPKVPLDTTFGHQGQAVAFLPNGRELAVVSADKIFVVDLTDESARFASLSRRAMATAMIAITPDGTAAIVGADYGPSSLWDLAPLRHRHQMPPTASFSLSPDGKMLAASHLDEVLLVDYRRPKLVSRIKNLEPGLLRFTADGDLANVVSNQVDFLDPKTGAVISPAAFVNQYKEITAIAISPDASFVAVGDAEGKVTVWRKKDGAIVKQFVFPDERDIMLISVQAFMALLALLCFGLAIHLPRKGRGS